MSQCKEDKDPCDILPQAGEAWSVCLPWGGRIWSDSNGVHAAGGIAPPDGVYGKIVIANGCLVGVEAEDVPLYTGSPCAPLPSGCGEGGGSLGPGLTPTPATITCEIEAGAGITITGDGTDANPYVIAVENNGIFLRSDNAAITVTGSGTRTSPFTITHKEGMATTINGMTFDAFGHLTSASEGGSATGSGTVNGLVPGFGITVDVNQTAGVATISQQAQVPSVPGNYQFGGYDVTLDTAGQVSRISQAINIEGAPLTAGCGGIDLTINQFGVITSIVDTFSVGASYTTAWGDGAEQKIAQFRMRSSSAISGICINEEQKYDDLKILINGVECDKIGAMFWGNGIFLQGLHTVEVQGGTGKLAIIIFATTMMEPL